MDKIKVFSLNCHKSIGNEVISNYNNLQVLDSRYVADKEHLEFAIIQAIRSFKRKKMISKNLMMEIMLKASAQRQIGKAIEIFGVKKSNLVYILTETLPVKLMREYKCNEVKILFNKKKYVDLKKQFKISDNEISVIAGTNSKERESVLKMIIKERIALLEAK
jgi:KEOPS complex subunit Cgi121